MKVYTLPIEMVNALRSWFHPKDRSVILADDTFIEGEEIVTPGNPPHNRGRLYWKNGHWTQLNESGAEQILTGPALIAETILTGSVTSVTFSGIPQIFRHLLIMGQVRTDRVAEVDGTLLRCNLDTGANYDRQTLAVNNATLTGVAARAQTSIQVGLGGAANSRASNFSPFIVEILGYSRTDAEKWTISRSAVFGDVSADSDLFLHHFAGEWRNTTAISSITLLPNVGPNFVSGSRFSLYGIS